MGDQKGFPMVFSFAVVTLLSCCQASNFFLPRVSRTGDAIIIDLDGSGYAAPFQRKSWYGQIANPGFIPVPSFNPYPMMFRQQRPSGWPYPSVYPSNLNPAGVPFYKQFDSEVEEVGPTDVKQAAPTCGGGPATMPKTGLAGGRVDGGTTAKKGAWPFMVAMRKNSDATLPFCSGTLISDTKVLLAAQCLEKMSLNDISSVTALVGMYSEDPTVDVQMTRRITKVVLHEKYNAFNFANDIAIFTLDSPVVLSKTVGPVCLPPASADPDQYVGQDAMIVGWGNTVKDTINLQQGKTSIMANSDCKFDATIGKYVTDNTNCITTAAAGPFTCDNDLGGPVVTLPSPGAWTIVGINSYTADCTSGGLKTRVSAYRDWIDKYMK